MHVKAVIDDSCLEQDVFGLAVTGASFVGSMYWAIQQSWFARVNALRNLSRRKS